MTAKEFLDEYAVDDLHVFGRHEEHYQLDGLMEEYAKKYHESEVKKLSRYNFIVNYDADNATLSDKKDKDGDYVKWEDIQKILNDL